MTDDNAKRYFDPNFIAEKLTSEQQAQIDSMEALHARRHTEYLFTKLGLAGLTPEEAGRRIRLYDEQQSKLTDERINEALKVLYPDSSYVKGL